MAARYNDAEVPLLSPERALSDHGEPAVGPQQYGATDSKDTVIVNISQDESEDEGVSDAEEGVQQADAINLVWSRSALILAYFFIFLCSFAAALQWQIISNLTPYVTSEFSSHSLIPTIGIVASILSGVLKLPISKIIDAWGRPQGLAAMTVLTTIGLILMAACKSVKTYAAALVFYQIGSSGFSYVLGIIIADTSSLKNRILAFAFSNTPNLATTFIGPVVAKAFYEKSSWRWAFGASSIWFFVLSLPVLVLLMWNARKAMKLGLLDKRRESTSTSKTFRHYLVDYDVVGAVLISSGLTMILVPFSLGSPPGDNWNMMSLIVGIVLMAAFALHERYFASKPTIAFPLLFSRNIAAACLLCICIFISYYCWDSYYSSYLQVVHGLSITQAGYIDHIYGFGSTIWAIIVGYLIRATDRYRWLSWIAVPIHLLGGCAMIAFRRPNTHVGLLVLCQCIITVGGSTLVMCTQIAVMAVCSHGELASAVAILSLASYVGSAGGNALSGSIWNSTLPKALAELLPNLSAEELKELCSDLKKQLSYPIGHPVRDAVIAAYDQAQVKMCLTALAIALLQIIPVVLWRDARVSEVKQVKGKVL